MDGWTQSKKPLAFDSAPEIQRICARWFRNWKAVFCEAVNWLNESAE